MRVTRRLLLLALLGIIFIGCKTKRTVSGNSDRGRYKSPPKVAEVKKEEKKKDEEDLIRKIELDCNIQYRSSSLPKT